MPVFAYNVKTPKKNFMVSEPSHRSFTENLMTEKSPREAWAQMMLLTQKENILNKRKLHPDSVHIKISSIEALQCKNLEQFNRLISELIKYDAQLYSIKEEAVFSKEFENGISNQPEKLEKAKAALEEKKQEEKLKPQEKTLTSARLMKTRKSIINI